MSTPVRKARASITWNSYALGFIVLFLAVYVLTIAREIFVPLVIAVFVWYLINAIARMLMSWRPMDIQIPRFLCFATAIATLLLGVYGIFALIKQNVRQVADRAPEYQQRFESIESHLMNLAGLDHIPTMSELVQKINIGEFIGRAAATFAGSTGMTVEVLFLTGFLLFEQRFFDHKIQGMSTDRKAEEKFRYILTDIDFKIQRYIGAKTLVSTLAAIATYGILRFAGVDFAAFWALLAFFLHFIPYVGTFGAIALPSIMTLVQFGDMGTFLSVVLALSIALMLIGHILDPRLLGELLNLSPICIILSLAVWREIWGVPGMFLAIPILAILVIVLSQFQSTRPFAVLLSKSGVLERQDKSKN
jgi:AI-2 transport protein TqsA